MTTELLRPLRRPIESLRVVLRSGYRRVILCALPEWASDHEWVWQQVSALALQRKAGDLEAAQRSAAGYWKGIFGSWPGWGKKLSPADYVDDRVEKRVRSGLIRWAKGKAKE